MNFTEDGYKVLNDVQKKCNELNQKIDSIIRIMEIMTVYMQYSNKMADMPEGPDMAQMADILSKMAGMSQMDHGAYMDGQPSQEQTFYDFQADSEEDSPPPMPERSETMNPNDFQKIMNAAKSSNQQMTQEEFNQIFETLKQGKSPEEVARMEQMVQLAKSFMK